MPPPRRLSFPGSPLYKAPEMLAKHPYTYTADMWSTGVIMFELLCGEPPFGEAMSLPQFVKLVKGFRGFGPICPDKTKHSEVIIEKRFFLLTLGFTRSSSRSST